MQILKLDIVTWQHCYSVGVVVSCIINPRRACARVTVLVNPRRACAARVTVVVLCVCMCVCMCVCPLIQGC